MKIIKWKGFKRNTLEGFFELELPSGMCIRDLTLHKKDGASWVGYPSRPYESDGKTMYQNTIFFPDKDVHFQFQKRVLSALDDYLAKQVEMPGQVDPQEQEEIP